MRRTDAIKLARARKLTASGDAERIRRAAGLSRPDVARVVNVAPVSVLRWERGDRRPSGAAAGRYVDLLDALVAVVEG